ncbi:MAG TPA: hypothetical protein VMR65_12405 [Candidatus Sulfotelmatobacter sp.]|jgi:hypothetical protein|nr:hypothetical protein [Candidatus Sulfotelmatobacter sp.]
MTDDPFRGLHPARPPSELRERVLAAARDAAIEQQTGLLEALLADRALRWCAVALAALAIAHAAIDLQVAPRLAVPPRVRPTIDGIQLMPDGGLTAADQRQDLAPLVDRPVTRTEG